jgi:hypothetical protein
MRRARRTLALFRAYKSGRAAARRAARGMVLIWKLLELPDMRGRVEYL